MTLCSILHQLEWHNNTRDQLTVSQMLPTCTCIRIVSCTQIYIPVVHENVHKIT